MSPLAEGTNTQLGRWNVKQVAAVKKKAAVVKIAVENIPVRILFQISFLRLQEKKNNKNTTTVWGLKLK